MAESEVYTMYWLAVDENPSNYAATSTIYETNIITVPYTEYNYTSANLIKISIILLLVLNFIII